jgi:glycine dehydrogenase
MHEFIFSLSKDSFARLDAAGTPKAQAMAKIGKLFLDFGVHAPTVAFPEIYGFMIEPTESFSLEELNHFIEMVKGIHLLLNENPEVLKSAPHFTPIKKVDEVDANKNLLFMEKLTKFPNVFENIIDPIQLSKMKTSEVCKKIVAAHANQ